MARVVMRYFENTMPDFKEAQRVPIDVTFWKKQVLSKTEEIVKKMPPTFDNCDGGLYTGCAGIAYMFYHLSQTEIFKDLKQNLIVRGRNYIDVALSYQERKSHDPMNAFLVGGSGVIAIGALIYHELGETRLRDDLVKRYQSLMAMQLPVVFNSAGSDELFVGRAGYLFGALLLNSKLGMVIDEVELHKLCAATVTAGRDYALRYKSHSTLMYAYHGTEYLGAGHGLASILQVLMSFPKFLLLDKDTESVIRNAVDFMLSLITPNGNTPPATDELGGRRTRPPEHELVHWCHGGPGIIYMYARAFIVWNDSRYLQAALKVGELVWQHGLLRKGPGLCHGVGGNGYVFLLLYRLTSDEQHLHRAVQFGKFLFTEEFKKANIPDTPFSLFEGWAGTCCFMADLTQPNKAAFPFFEVFIK